MRFILLAFLTLTFLTSCISREMRALDAETQNAAAILVVADRGASDVAPENTLAAFDKAQNLGAVAVEFHVQLSKDSQVVVFNDDSLEQKTGLPGTVASKSWADLSKADLATWFGRLKNTSTAVVKLNAEKTPKRVDSSGSAVAKRTKPAREIDKYLLRSQGRSRATTTKKRVKTKSSSSLTRLVTLDEVFERYGLTFQYYIVLHSTSGADSQSQNAKLAQETLRLINEYGIASNAVVASNDYDQLSRLHQANPTLSLCYLIDDAKTPDVNAEIQRSVTLGFEQIGIRTPLVTIDHVKRAKSVKIKVYAYGSATDDELIRASKTGIAAIASPRPDHAAKMIEDASKTRY